MNILIVEDDKDFSKELSGAITLLGHRCVCVGDVDAALTVLEQEDDNFDLIITDVRLPGKDGLEFLRIVKSRMGPVPVAVMSGHGDADVTIAALRGGAFDFLPKPFGLTEIEAMLERVPTEPLHEALQSELITSVVGDTCISLVSTQRSVNKAVSLFREMFGAYCLAIDCDINNVCLCLAEALQNAVVHGNMGIGSANSDELDGFDEYWNQITAAEEDETIRNKPVNICVRTDGVGLRLKITDEGEGFDYKSYDFSSADTLATNGRGLYLMFSLSKSVEFSGIGNCVTLNY